MTALLEPIPTTRRQNLADLIDLLGGVPLQRIRTRNIGHATESDLLDVYQREHAICELVEGVLVEKPMGLWESHLAMVIGTILQNFIGPRKLGIITGEAGTMRLMPGLVRIPDVAFTSNQRLPRNRDEPIPTLVPDLAVEVLSKSNTADEMALKRREYFRAGVCVVWEVDLKFKTVRVFTSPDNVVVLSIDQSLDGGDVLPGLIIPLTQIFAELTDQ